MPSAACSRCSCVPLSKPARSMGTIDCTPLARENPRDMSSKGCRFDSSPKRHDQVFQLVLVDGLDEMLEGFPCCSHHVVRRVIKEIDKNTDPVDPIVGGIRTVHLAQRRKDIASSRTTSGVRIFRPDLSATFSVCVYHPIKSISSRWTPSLSVTEDSIASIAD